MHIYVYMYMCIYIYIYIYICTCKPEAGGSEGDESGGELQGAREQTADPTPEGKARPGKSEGKAR